MSFQAGCLILLVLGGLERKWRFVRTTYVCHALRSFLKTKWRQGQERDFPGSSKHSMITALKRSPTFIPSMMASSVFCHCLCLVALSSTSVLSFAPFRFQYQYKYRKAFLKMSDSSTETTVASTSTTVASTSTSMKEPSTIDRSTLVLLEHVNLNIPNHQYAIPFYIDLLGCGLDPRRADNVIKGEGTIWANCGASQFHLPFGTEPQQIPGHIGLRYNTLNNLKARIAKAQQDDNKCFAHVEFGHDKQSGKEYIQLVDRYNNTFVCRERPDTTTDNDNDNDNHNPTTFCRQPILTATNHDFGEPLAIQYGKDESDCRGIDYVEFRCPRQTAERIALFYDSVFDATTFVVENDDDGTKIAIIGFGHIDEHGRSAQSLLFRESDEPTPRYDGHHVAIYVGDNKDDFELAFKNIEQAGVVWINPRFSDKAGNLNGAKKWKQFRFKDIVDLHTGAVIFKLEHEMRSREHEAWPGQTL